MTETIPPENSLALYKNRPARVKSADDKLTLELETGESIRVRPKDVSLLHPGPLRSLADLRPPAGDVATAWELLAGSETTLPELAELVFGANSPATAWATYQLLLDGLYFHGTQDRITARTTAEVAQTQAARAAEAAEKAAWNAFLARARAGQVAAEDRRYLREVEDLALKRTERSRVLRALGREESPENAHAALLEFGAWDDSVNPHPRRLGLNLTLPGLALPAGRGDPASLLRQLDRYDLTALTAYAIDDPWTETPDDALSFEPGPGLGRLWVHVADGAALIAPDDPIDLEARERGVTLHLPEGVTPMLPPATTPILGLGLSMLSPALSFRIDLDDEAGITDLQIVPSVVRVVRVTYEEADARIETEPLCSLQRIAEAYERRRWASGAVRIELPEATVRLRDGEISIRPVLPVRSRSLVENAMILAGEAVADYAARHDIPMPHATQDPPDNTETGEDKSYSAMFALRRSMKRSQYRSVPAPHSGLGLTAYAQVTSPLRRYLDLVVHQQLRAHLGGRPLLDSAAILERIGAIEATIYNVRQAEQLSNRHWTLVYLGRLAGWRGRAVLVDKRGQSGTFIVPELAHEAQAHLPADLPLDTEITLALRSVDLARQDARFRVEG